MKVNDKREKRGIILFKELKVGQAYEDIDHILCIKTAENELDADVNCICFTNDGTWTSYLEILDAEVTPLVTTLEIER